MLRHHVPVWDIVRHLTQAIHVVGKGNQTSLDVVIGEHAKGVSHHGGARDLAEGADVRQARGAVAGLEHHLVLWALFQPRDDLARFLERPGIRAFGNLAQRRDLERGHQWLSGRGHYHSPQRPSKHAFHPPVRSCSFERGAHDRESHAELRAQPRNKAQLSGSRIVSLPFFTAIPTPWPKYRPSM